MTRPASQMRREILDIPVAVDRLLGAGGDAVRRAAAAMRAADPAFLVTGARGSSDHVATYLKYVSELLAGVPVASIGPSTASIYHAKLRLAGSVCLSVSQSGASPDILALARSARAAGALGIAITNTETSPLAGAADHLLPIHAGPELSVAATKTFVSSAVAGLWLIAEWQGDAALLAAIRALPEALARAAAIDWPQMRAAIGEGSLFTLGRGPSWAISNEAALKFKETCRIHAESYSSAEVLHGPVSIVDRGFPVLCFAAHDAAETAVAEIADRIAATGAQVFATTDATRAARTVECVRTAHPLTDPLSLIVSFYAMVERIATERGIDPDAPRHLRKVTETI
ncbi:MAG: SIS domain-containing protein [Alphaproteobacteria bacterium]|nr:MAG: SIS domain-containing protein [Alphaproteobacteria bacterium]